MQAFVKRAISLAALLCLAAPLGAAPAKSQKQLADSMEKKIAAVRENGARERPKGQTTVFAQDEINAYFAERRLPMPEGVRSVTFDLTPGKVFSRARIDFDEITRERRNRNPLMHLFTGTHNVEVAARATSAGPGRVRVNVESVAIGGVTVPRMALQFFIERFVNPKYPNVRLDGEYTLPSRMDSVTIETRKGTVLQK